MLFVVRFVDDPTKLNVRRQLLPAHIDYLDDVHDRVLVAGSLREDPGAMPVGGLWIVEADSKEEVNALIRDDPFWKAGLRTECHILHWSKAFENRKALV